MNWSRLKFEKKNNRLIAWSVSKATDEYIF